MTSSSSDRPPTGLEIKAAATMLAPRPGEPTLDTGSVAPKGVVELISAMTGVRDDVADIIVPGAFRRTIGERRPKVCSSHRWDQPIGRAAQPPGRPLEAGGLLFRRFGYAHAGGGGGGL